MEIAHFDPGYSVYGLAVSPEGNRVAVGTKAGLLQVHALDLRGTEDESSSLLLDMFHPPAVVSLTFCTNDILASGGLDGKIRLWSLQTKSQVAEIDAHAGGVLATCRIGSLLLATIGRDRALRIWDMDTLQARFTHEDIILPKVQAMTSLDYDPCKCLLVHPSGSGELFVYDIRQEFSVKKLPAHQGDFCAVSCGADWLATAGAADGSLKVWSGRFDQLEMEASTGTGPLAITWAGKDVLVTVDAEGNAHTWNVGSELSPGPGLPKANLRICLGLPGEVIARSCSDSLREWRDAKINEAQEFMGRDDRGSGARLRQIVEELRNRGFSAEAALVLADTAKAQGRLLWELDARLAVVRGLGEGAISVPSMYAVGDLLARACEPELAMKYFRKVREHQPNYRDIDQRLLELQAHPLLRLSPEAGIRGDLTKREHVLQEFEKHNILDKRFTWSIVLETKQSIRVGAPIDPDDAFQELAAELGKSKTDGPVVTLRRDSLYQRGDVREVEWIRVQPDCLDLSVAYALEFGAATGGSVVTPHVLFDISRLRMQQSTVARDYNRMVQDAWEKVVHGHSAKQWLTDVHRIALGTVHRLKGKAISQADEALF